MNVTTVGSDLVKNVFSAHGKRKDGKVLVRSAEGRADLLPLFASPPRLMEMEAHSGVLLCAWLHGPLPTHDHGATLCRAIQRCWRVRRHGGDLRSSQASYLR